MKAATAIQRVLQNSRVRTRVFLPLVLVLFLLPGHGLILWGVALAFAGSGLRIWACGHLEKFAPDLTTSGPYRFTRNPLYLGSLLIGLGLCWAVRSWPLAVLFLAIFIPLYWITIRSEEAKLVEAYGEPYLEYRRQVPRFWPRLTPWPNQPGRPFRWRLVIHNRELNHALALLLLTVLLELKHQAVHWLRGFH